MIRTLGRGAGRVLGGVDGTLGTLKRLFYIETWFLEVTGSITDPVKGVSGRAKDNGHLPLWTSVVCKGAQL